MVKIIIPESTSKVRERDVAQTGALALPMSLATKVGESYSAVGKIFDDISKEQAATEDQNTLNDIIKEVSVDMNTVKTGASKNTDVKFAVKAYDDNTKLSKYEKFLEGKNPRVKNYFKQWLSKTKRSDYASIANTVTNNHIKKTKYTFEQKADELTLKMASKDLIVSARAKKEWERLQNQAEYKSVYSDDEWNKIVDDKNLQAKRYQVTFGAKNHPNYVLNNADKIEKEFGPLGKKAVETAKYKILSDTQKEYNQQKVQEEFENKKKIEVFGSILKSLQGDDTPESLGNIPTIDLVTDLKKAGKLNSAQYNALLDFIANPQKLSDDDVLDLINGQLMIADSVEDLDELQKQISLTPEYLIGLGIKDYEKINSLIEKNKDRQVFQEYKYYKEIIGDVLGKVDNGYFKSFGATSGEDQKNRTKAINLYQDYIDQGFSPEDSYLKTVKGFMVQKGVVPTIYDAAKLTSITVKQPDKVSTDSKQPKEIFNDYRSEAMKAYKDGKISINELKNDLEGLDTMERVFEVRSKIQGIDPWGTANKLGSTATASK